MHYLGLQGAYGNVGKQCKPSTLPMTFGGHLRAASVIHCGPHRAAMRRRKSATAVVEVDAEDVARSAGTTAT